MSEVERVSANESDVAHLLARHFDLMRAQTPAESCHVLPATAMSSPDLVLFALRENGRAVAVGALRIVGRQGELKSMHTVKEKRGQGLGRRLLLGLIAQARDLGLEELLLETGAGADHLAARKLYSSEGFAQCPPFGDYTEDPLSVFMSRSL